MNCHTYTVCHCDGKIEKFRVPQLFEPGEVAKRLPHCNVYLHIPKGWDVLVSNLCRHVNGPCIVCVDAEGDYKWVPHAPVDDRDDLSLWNNYLHVDREVA